MVFWNVYSHLKIVPDTLLCERIAYVYIIYLEPEDRRSTVDKNRLTEIPDKRIIKNWRSSYIFIHGTNLENFNHYLHMTSLPRKLKPSNSTAELEYWGTNTGNKNILIIHEITATFFVNRNAYLLKFYIKITLTLTTVKTFSKNAFLRSVQCWLLRPREQQQQLHNAA
jgi:hypothetical protein